MSKHDHPKPAPPCAHESLKFCAKCDAVECTACGAEWKNQPVSVITAPCYRRHKDERPWVWPTSPQLPGITWGPNTGDQMPQPTKIWCGTSAHIGVTRKNEAAGVHVVEYVYALDSIQREQLREALK